MQPDDLIIISVDDHVVEPPNLFENHLPARYKDIAPRIKHMDDGSDQWEFCGINIPNVGLNAVAGRPQRSTAGSPPRSTSCGWAVMTSMSGSRT